MTLEMGSCDGPLIMLVYVPTKKIEMILLMYIILQGFISGVWTQRCVCPVQKYTASTSCTKRITGTSLYTPFDIKWVILGSAISSTFNKLNIYYYKISYIYAVMIYIVKNMF